jgi:hypothetical protein
MSDTIHINLGGFQTDTHYVGTYTVRVWPHLLSTVNWIIKNPIPGNFLIQHGISMTIANNLAIAMEGFIADICWDYAGNKSHLKPSLASLDTMTWQAKKKLYNELFEKKIEEYSEFDGVSALMNFRNNLAHGRTYTEYVSREINGPVVSEIETDNKVYQNLRDYLIGRGILSSRNISSNTEVPWKIETACHFAGLVKYFMQNILRENESDNKLGIETEFKLAFELT